MASVFNRGRGKKQNWWAQIKIDGVWRQVKTSQPTEKTALTWAMEVEAKAARGELGLADLSKASKPKLTLQELITKFLKEYAPEADDITDPKKYLREAKSSMKPFGDTWGNRPASAITQADLKTWIAGQVKSGSAGGTISNRVRQLSKVYGWGKEHGLVTDNPCKGLKSPPRNKSFDFYTAEQAAKLIVACEGNLWLKTLVTVAIYCGLRRCEIAGMRWEDLDLDRKVLTVKRSYKTNRTKSKKDRHLPLRPGVITALQAWKEQCPPTEMGLVFPMKRDRWTDRLTMMSKDNKLVMSLLKGAKVRIY